MKRTLYILSFLITTTAQAQFKKDWPVYALQLIAGSADGVNQSITHHHLGQGDRFWDADISWENKYKNWPTDKRAAYPGSKSFLVWTTDGYHLTRFIDRSAMVVSIVIAGKGELGDKKKRTFWHYALKYGSLMLINRIGFSLTYNVIFKQK